VGAAFPTVAGRGRGRAGAAESGGGRAQQSPFQSFEFGSVETRRGSSSASGSGREEGKRMGSSG